jgi:hypothetical protein
LFPAHLRFSVALLALLGAACSEASDGPHAAAANSMSGMGGSASSGAGDGGGTAGGGAGASGGAGSGCTQRELFTNGNFEAGGNGWTESSSKWPALIVTSAMTGENAKAQSGGYLARLGGYAEAGQDSMISTVSVPASAKNIVFSFYSIVTTEESSADRRDSLFLSLDSDIQYVEQVLDNTTVHANWQHYQMAISSEAAGKSLVMLIRAENDGTNATTFLLDSMSLSATVCP